MQRSGTDPRLAFGTVVGSRRFLTRLGFITLGAGIWRIWYVVGPVMSRIPRLGIDDEFFYSAQARLVADGKGFLNPFGYFAPVGHARRTGSSRPRSTRRSTPCSSPSPPSSASRPPRSSASSPRCWARARCCSSVCSDASSRATAPGSSPRSSPPCTPALWVNDAMLGLETLYGFLVILALFAFYRLWRNPTLGNAALFALCLSLATLTRSEGAMLFVLLRASRR